MTTAGISARVLVVEDDAIVATDIEQALEGMGYDVLGVLPDGDDAVDAARDLEPDVVLMDIRLPGNLDGIQAGTAVAEALDIPVVYLTAYSDPATLERAKAAGSWGYLVKPFDNSGLRAAIEVAIHRHRAQSLLKESEERYWTTLEVIPSAVIVTDANGVITQANPASEYLLARPREDIEGQPTSRVIKLVNRNGHPLPDPVETALREGGMVFLTGQNSIRLAGGRSQPVRGSVALMKGGRDRVVGAVLVLDDVLVDSVARDKASSEAPSLEIEVTGRMAVGFAHLLREDPETLRSAMVRLLAAGQRAPASPRVVSVTDLVTELHPSLSETAGPSVSVLVEGTETPALARIDPTLLGEALSAVVVNAREAMSPEVRVAVSVNAAGQVVLSVEDSGVGMTAAVLDQAPEPFFTTKPSGSGLGLSFAQGVVRQAGGWMVLSSTPNAGTTVAFHLPSIGDPTN